MNLPEREWRRIQERSKQIRRKRIRKLFKNANPALRPTTTRASVLVSLRGGTRTSAPTAES